MSTRSPWSEAGSASGHRRSAQLRAQVLEPARVFRQIRDAFDIMGTETENDWSSVISRLNALPATVRAIASGSRSCRRRGMTALVRQVRAAAETRAHAQFDRLGAPGLPRFANYPIETYAQCSIP